MTTRVWSIGTSAVWNWPTQVPANAATSAGTSAPGATTVTFGGIGVGGWSEEEAHEAVARITTIMADAVLIARAQFRDTPVDRFCPVTPGSPSGRMVVRERSRRLGFPLRGVVG